MSKRFEEMTEPELRTACVAAAKAVEASVPPGTLFMLLLFDDPKFAQYVSNCCRSTRVQALREAADRLEGKDDVPR